MIAGETQMLLAEYLDDDQYDNFLFGSKEKRAERKAARIARRTARKSDPKRQLRKAKRKDFFSRLGQAYKDLGGGAAIGGALDTLVTKPAVTPMVAATPSDFELSLAEDTNTIANRSSDTLLIIGGAVVVVSILGAVAYQSRKGMSIPK